MTQRILSVVLVLAAFNADRSNAGTVVAKLDGVVIASEVAGELEVSVGNIVQDWLLQIYDENANATSGPSGSVVRIRIRGERGSATARLRLLIANPVLHSTFPASPNVVLAPGVVNLGSQGTAVVEFESDLLRDATSAAVAVSGDVLGSVEVGQAFRIQAFGDGLSGGMIVGAITARQADTGSAINELAIGVVKASRMIGNVTSQQGSI